MSFELKVDQTKFDRLVKLFPQKCRVEFADDLDYIKRKFHKEFKAQRLQGKPGVQAYPGGLFSHFKSIRVYKGTAVDGMGIYLFTRSPVAHGHQFGGTITNPSGGRIPVPLSSAKKTSFNSDLFTKSGQLNKRYKKDLSLIKGLFKINTKKGQEMLFRRKKGDKYMRPIFILKHQITIEDVLEYFETFEKLTPVWIKRINKSLDRIIDNL